MPYNFAEQPNFGSGLAAGADKTLESFVMPNETLRNQSKLSLQMMNSKIEAEQNSRLQEAKAHQESQVVPPEEMQKINSIMGSIMKSAHDHTPMPNIDTTGITSQPGQAMFSGQFKEAMQSLTMAGRFDKPTTHLITDPITGKQTLVAVDPFTGQPTWQADGGTGSAAAKGMAQGRSTYFKMQHLADTKEKEITAFASSSSPLQAAMQSGQLTLAQVANLNPEAKATLDQLPFAGMTLEKTFLGGLPRSQQMQGSGVNYLFSMNDTVTPPEGVPNPNGGPNIIGSFNLKMKKARKLGFDAAQSAYDTYGRPLDKDIVDPEMSTILNPQQPSGLSFEQRLARATGKQPK